MNRWIAFSALGTITALALGACSDDEDDADGNVTSTTATSSSASVSASASASGSGGATASSTTGSGGTISAGGAGGSGGSTTGAGGAASCMGQPECATCCADATGGYEAYVTALLLACACDPGQGPADPAPCLDECDTAANDVCTGATTVSLTAFTMNAACSQCITTLNTVETCFGGIASNCDAKCGEYLTCAQSCNG